MPVTATNKIHRVGLRSEGFHCPDPVWWRPPGERAYRPLTTADTDSLVARYRAHGREDLLSRPARGQGSCRPSGPRGRSRTRSGRRVPEGGRIRAVRSRGPDGARSPGPLTVFGMIRPVAYTGYLVGGVLVGAPLSVGLLALGTLGAALTPVLVGLPCSACSRCPAYPSASSNADGWRGSTGPP